MEQKEREEIAKSMIKMGLRLWRNLFLEMLFGFLILLIMLIIGKVSLVYSAAGACLFAAAIFISRLNRVIFAVGAISHAIYMRRHPMECFQIKVKKYYRSVLSFLEMGYVRLHLYDKAKYVLDGSTYTAYMYRAAKDGDGMLLVFRDLEKRKKVFAFPAVYINKRPEISDSI